MSERLDTRYLVVNGDDLGMSSGVNRGIVEAHLQGVVTSASLMVDRPAAQEAAALTRELPALGVGLHLELAHDARDDVRAAMRHQLDRFEFLMGRLPSHIDSHRDLHRNPDVLPHSIEMARRLDVPLRGRSRIRCVTSFYGQWGGEVHPEQVSVENLISLLDSEVGDGVTELICHPGYVDPTLDSSYAGVRETELQTLCDPRLVEFLVRARIRLASFSDLHALFTGEPYRTKRPRQPI